MKWLKLFVLEILVKTWKKNDHYLLNLKLCLLSNLVSNVKNNCGIYLKNNIYTSGKFYYGKIIAAPPELSIANSPLSRKIECEVTENWKPELQLCWITQDGYECHVS